MRKTDFYFNTLLVIFVVSIVTSNVISARVIATPWTFFGIPVATPGGVITYAFTFLCTDIIGELWGKEKAMGVVKYGFIGQLFALAFITLTGILPAKDAGMGAAYATLLGQNWCFVAGSLVAYYVSQTWDVWVFHRLRDWYCYRFVSTNFGPTSTCYTGQGRWIWNNLSTMTSQILDTVIYCGISFGIGLGWLFKAETMPLFVGICVGQYVVKFLLAALDTPIFYLLTRREKERPSDFIRGRATR